MPLINKNPEYSQEQLFQKAITTHPELTPHSPKHQKRSQLNLMICGDQGTGKSSFIECLLKLVDFRQTKKLHLFDQSSTTKVTEFDLKTDKMYFKVVDTPGVNQG